MNRRLSLLALVAALGCDEGASLPWEEPPAPAKPTTAAHVTGPVAVAKAVRAPAPLPDRLTAPLPTSADAVLDLWNDPARLGLVRQRLCLEEPEAVAEWEQAARLAWSEGTPVAQITSTFGELPRPCSRPERCERVRERLEAPAPGEDDAETAVRAMYWHALLDCDGPDDAAMFERPEASASDLLQWHRSRAWTRGSWSPRLATVLEEAVVAGDPARTRELAALVVNADAAKGAEVVIGLHGKTRSRDVRDALTASLWRVHDGQAGRMIEELCERRGASLDEYGQPLYAECQWRTTSPTWQIPDPIVETDRWVRAWNAEPAAWIARRPDQRDAVVDALARCVADERSAWGTGADSAAPWTLRNCVYNLAAVDRPAATAAVADLPPAGSLSDLDRLAGSLRRFPTVDAMQQHAAALGLVPEGGVPEGGKPVVTMVDLLRRHGRLYDGMDYGGGWPIDHETVLRSMAGLAPPLHDAVFESLPPRWDEAGQRVTGDDVVLLAYHGGQRWRVHMQDDSGEFYLLTPLFGLLNAMLEEAGSDLRYAETTDGFVFVAPEAAIVAAKEDGLLDLADPALDLAPPMPGLGYYE